MVIDSSVLVAVVRRESEAELFTAEIIHDEHSCISAASLVETHLVLSRNRQHVLLLSEFVSQSGIEIIPVTAEIAAIAQRASTPYGRGTRANLNFGDLFSYATAKALDMPLLFKGNDFIHTDVRRPALRM
jgi:ribonuclease VapC